jgi:hypothetical protein
LRGCEETLEHINSCLDKDSERSVCISSIFKRHGHQRIILNCLTILSWDSSVGIAVGCGLDSQGSIPGRGKIFLFSTASRPALGPTQPPIQWVPGVISLGVKQPGHEADYLAPSSAEVKNSGVIPPLPHMS